MRLKRPSKPQLNNSHTKLFITDTITDISPRNAAITNNNVTLQTANYNHNYANSVGYFSTLTSYLSTPFNKDFNFSGAFTIEFWLFMVTPPAANDALSFFHALDITNSYSGLRFAYLNNAGTYRFRLEIEEAPAPTYTYTIPLNIWTHIALTRSSSGVLNVYVDGTMYALGTINSSINLSLTNTIKFMYVNSAATPCNFYVSDYKISNIARYSANFTPPTVAYTVDTNTVLLLAMDNLKGGYAIAADTKSNTALSIGNTVSLKQQASLATYNAFFNGTSDYLLLENSINLNFGLNDFTIEGWFFPSESTVSYQSLFRLCKSTSYGFALAIDPVNKYVALHISSNNSAWDICSNNNCGSYLAETWNHIAVSRSGSTFYIFINGRLTHSFTSTLALLTCNIPACLGAIYTTSASYFYQGYLAEWRISKVARYTSNFVPATTFSTDVNTLAYLPLNDWIGTTRQVSDTYAARIPTIANNSSIKAVSRLGNTTNSACFFDGNSYLYSQSGDYAVGTGDFCIEGFIWACVAENRGVFHLSTGFLPSSAASSVALSQQVDGWALYANGTSYYIYAAPVTKHWIHFAVVRSGGYYRVYLDSALVFSVATTDNITYQHLVIGGYYSTGYLWKGYINNFRFSSTNRGYTGNYITVSLSNFIADANSRLLLPLSGSNVPGVGLKNSINNVEFNVGVGYTVRQLPYINFADVGCRFNGSSYLSIPDHSDFKCAATGSWSLEFWWYITPNIPSYRTIVSKGYTTAGDLLIQTDNNINPKMFVYLNSTYVSETTAATHNRLYFYQITYNNGTITIYRNGIQTGTGTISSAITSVANFNIGLGSTYYLIGYLTELRWRSGTSAFINVPTATLTADSYTKLLLNMTTAGSSYTDTSGTGKVITNTNCININYRLNLDKAMLFNTTSNVKLPSSSNFDFGSGNFTVEWWEMRPGTPAANGCIIARDGTTVYTPFLIGYESSNTLYCYASSNNSSWDVISNLSMGSIDRGVWTHYAITRSGSTFYTFKNGVLVATATSSTAFWTSTGTVSLGTWYNNNTYPCNAMVAWLHVVKGAALYTANFAPPISPVQHANSVAIITPDYNTNYFNDIATNGISVDIYGNPRQLRSYPNVATALEQSSGGLTFPYTATSMDFLNKDFTIEGWFLYTGGSGINSTMFDTRTAAGYGILLSNNWANGYFTIYLSSTGTSWDIASNWNIAPTIYNRWFHFALCRQGNNIRAYIDGQYCGKIVSSASFYTSARPFGIGSFSDGTSYPFVGQIGWAHLAMGVAKYTAETACAFIPPLVAATTANTVLNCVPVNNLRTFFIEKSSSTLPKLVTVGTTKQSISKVPFENYLNFVGTSGISRPYINGDLNFSTNNFTIEGLFYFTGTASDYCSLVDFRGDTGYGILIGATWGSGNITIYISSTGTSWDIANAWLPVATPYKKWSHFALCRTGNDIRFYLDGKFCSKVTSSAAIYNPNKYMGVGSHGNTTSNVFKGRIGWVNVINGAALYSSEPTDFNPPLVPQGGLTTNIATIVPGCDRNLFLEKSSVSLPKPIINTSALQSYMPIKNHLNFNGASYLTTVSDSSLQLGANDFTLDAWVRPTSNTAGDIFSKTATTSYGYRVGWDSGYFTVYLTSSGSGWDILHGNPTVLKIAAGTLNVWQHIALVRFGSKFTFYVDGAPKYTFTSLAALFNDAYNLNIGMLSYSGGNQYFTGNISNARVTNGSALWTSAFKPPTRI